MEEEREDRISRLPDEILQHIISLIDIQQAVETSILSRRWKKVWVSLSDLNFIFYFDIYSKFPADWEVAKNFVDQFLSRRDHTSTTRKFHLSFEGLNYYDNGIAASHPSFVEKCTFYAINHGVTDLHLDAIYSNPVFMAPGTACKTLLELKLMFFGNCIDLPKWFSLPHLKTLHLEDACFGYSEGTLSGFPELEKLTLKRCRMDRIHIFFPKLRNLEIILCHNWCGRTERAVEEISTPELTSFRYEGLSSPLLCSKANNFQMLEEAYFDFKHGNENTWKFMLQFGNAKIVTLSLHIIKALELNCGDYIKRNPSPIFPNLKCLKYIKLYWGIPNVPVRRSVMNYLTNTKSSYGDSVKVELPEGVSVVDSNSQDLFDEESEELLFLIED